MTSKSKNAVPDQAALLKYLQTYRLERIERYRELSTWVPLGLEKQFARAGLERGIAAEAQFGKRLDAAFRFRNRTRHPTLNDFRNAVHLDKLDDDARAAERAGRKAATKKAKALYRHALTEQLGIETWVLAERAECAETIEEMEFYDRLLEQRGRVLTEDKAVRENSNARKGGQVRAQERRDKGDAHRQQAAEIRRPLTRRALAKLIARKHGGKQGTVRDHLSKKSG